tara:strand:- start:17481 stop:17867 length:387 start_codon:yes stop_codon:yes gene_type:complete
MNIFQAIEGVIKTKKFGNLSEEDEGAVNSFMVQRWCSMHKPQVAVLLNEHFNDKVWDVDFDDTHQMLNYMAALLPKMYLRTYGGIKYIKKKAKKKALTKSEKEHADNVERLSEIYELSQKEIEQLISR